MQRRALTGLLLLSIALFGGCDDRPVPRTTSPSSTTQTTPRSNMIVTTVAPLLPARLTHVAVDPAGNVYWTQEGAGDGANRVFAVDKSGVPRATPLSAAGVLATMGAPSTAGGSLQSIAAGADGRIYFYFTGGSGATVIAALGCLDPSSGQIRILVGTSPLRGAARMGADLALARGSLIPVLGGKQIWFWLRHSDQSSLLTFDADLAPGAADAAPFSLRRQFESVTLISDASATQPIEPARLSLTSDSQLLGPGGDDGSLLLLDIPASVLRRIDPETGRARNVASLTALPQGLSQPTADPRPDAPPGRIVLFASDSDHLPAHSVEQAAEIPLVERVTYPALLIVEPPRTVRVINAARIETRAGYPLAQMALQQMVYAGDDAWIAYDAGSGELLRLQQ